MEKEIHSAIDWTQTDLVSHQTAWDQAKADFIRDMGHAPACSADISAIARRAEAIRKGEQ